MKISIEEIRHLSRRELASSSRIQKLLEDIEASFGEEDRDEALYVLARHLEEEWMLEQSRSVAELIADGVGEKVEALARIGLKMARLHDAKQAQTTFQLAIRAARECEPLWLKADSLLGIARAVSQAGFVDLASEILAEATETAQDGELGGPQDALDAAGVLGEIAEEWVLMGTHERAMATARQIRNRARRDRALGRVQAMVDILQRAANPR